MKRMPMTSIAMCLLFIIPDAGFGQTGIAENTPNACQDGVENDGDGLVDCADQDCSLFIFCAQAPSPTPPSTPPSSPAPAPAPAAVPAQPTYVLPPENTVALCNDRQDNDADGLIDCHDQDCVIANLCNPPQAAPVQGTAHKSRGGLGLYGSLVVFTLGKYDWTDNLSSTDGNKEWIMAPVTGGVGIFAEAELRQFIALGIEINLFFPKADKVINNGGPEIECRGCQTDILFGIALRLKFPIKIGKFVAPYPLIMMGFGNYTSKAEDKNARNYKGLIAGAALGVEAYPLRFLTPFFECRYTFLFGTNTFTEGGADLSESLQIHSVSLNFGVRFL